MPILLNTTHNIQEWGSNPGYVGETPDDVKAIYRFLAVVTWLGLMKPRTMMVATKRNKVARMVIKRLIEMP